MQVSAIFQSHTSRIPSLFSALDSADLFLMQFRRRSAPNAPAVYVLFDRGKPVHIGRTRDLRRRLQDHVTKDHNKASFAFKCARRALGLKATYKKDGSRKELMLNHDFLKCFLGNIELLLNMEFKFIEITNPIDQYLLELSAHMEYGLPLDEFDTH
jgi:predicted GIY-YIG superfamily endonuclease